MPRIQFLEFFWRKCVIDRSQKSIRQSFHLKIIKNNNHNFNHITIVSFDYFINPTISELLETGNKMKRKMK